MNHFYRLVLFFVFIHFQSTAQIFSNKEVGEKNAQKIDSLKEAEYPYVLPIWGAKATQAGFTLPYSAGLSLNYLWQKSDLEINNLRVGFNNSPMFELDDIIRFNNATATTNAINFRPDFWLFPFLNVYGILARSSSSTAVDFGVFVPNGTGYTEVISLNTIANFEGTTSGFGLTPTIGVGGGWFALDMNMTWTDIPALEKPAFTFVLGPRLGKTFYFQKEHSNLAVWVGGFRAAINSDTQGTLSLNEILPEGVNEKVENGYIRIDEAQSNLDSWWENLTPIEQSRPINQQKYERGNNALSRAEELLDGIGSSTVKYALDKKQKDLWNFVLGTQYQINRNWMIRAEYGFLSSRTQFIGGLQYRFGL